MASATARAICSWPGRASPPPGMALTTRRRALATVSSGPAIVAEATDRPGNPAGPGPAVALLARVEGTPQGHLDSSGLPVVYCAALPPVGAGRRGRAACDRLEHRQHRRVGSVRRRRVQPTVSVG